MKLNLENPEIHYKQYGDGKPLICLHGYHLDHICLSRPVVSHFLYWILFYGGSLARALVKHRPQQLKGMCLLCPDIIPDHGSRLLPEFRIFEQDKNFIQILSDREFLSHQNSLSRDAEKPATPCLRL